MSPNDWYNVSRILLGNSTKTVMTSIEGMNKIGTGPKMNGAFKSSLIDLETYGNSYGDKAQVAFAIA